MLHLIVIAGPSGGGKSTHTDALVDRGDGEKLSFATYLKETAAQHGWDGVKDVAGRTLLQNLQFKLKAAEGEDVFAQRLIDKAVVLNRKGVFTVIVDDHRFAIERATLKAWESKAKKTRKVTFVKFKDTKAENHWKSEFLASKPWAMHVSELEWRGFPDEAWDIIFNNDRLSGIAKSVENLVTQLDWVISMKNKKAVK